MSKKLAKSKQSQDFISETVYIMRAAIMRLLVASLTSHYVIALKRTGKRKALQLFPR